MAVVRQAVQEGCRHPFALEDLAPLAEGEVAREEQAPTFVAICEDLKEQFRSGATECEIAQFIHNQELKLVELCEEPVELVLLLGSLQLVHKCSGGEELRLDPFTTSGRAQCDRQMRLSSSRLTDQAKIGSFADPFAAGEFQDLLLAEGGHR